MPSVTPRARIGTHIIELSPYSRTALARAGLLPIQETNAGSSMPVSTALPVARTWAGGEDRG
jgi:hypothetical protein